MSSHDEDFWNDYDYYQRTGENAEFFEDSPEESSEYVQEDERYQAAYALRLKKQEAFRAACRKKKVAQSEIRSRERNGKA